MDPRFTWEISAERNGKQTACRLSVATNAQLLKRGKADEMCIRDRDNNAPLPEGLTFFPEYLQAAGYETAFFGKWHMGNDTGEPQPGFDHWEGIRGQGVYWDPEININGEWKEFKDSTYLGDLLTDHAIDFIRKQHAADKPFFVYLSHKGVHDPFQAPKRYEGCYADKEVPLPASFENPHYGIAPTPNKPSEAGKPLSGKDYYGEQMKPRCV